jgi:hypothetical protein
LQVLLEAAIAAGSTENLVVEYPDFNKHIEDPLSLTRRAGGRWRHRQRESSLLAAGRQASGQASVSIIEVPEGMRDQTLDLTRCVTRSYHAAVVQHLCRNES